MTHNGTERPLLPGLDDNVRAIRLALHGTNELIVRELPGGTGRSRTAVVYMDGLADRDLVQQHILLPLIALPTNEHGLDGICAHIAAGGLRRERSLAKTIESLIYSSTIVLVDGAVECIIVSTEGWEHRSVGSPSSEKSIVGPQDSFVEVLRVNTALLRRRIKDPAMVVSLQQVGTRSKTDISIVYLEDVANPGIVEEVKRRLGTFDGDMLLDSSELAEHLEDQIWSPFPQIAYTERVDRAASAVLEGRVAVLVDGTPFAIYMPVTFSEMMITSEDYYTKFYSAAFTRWIRMLALTIALLMPSLYIAVSSFHQEMIPTELMIMIAANRTGIPFPTLLEALLMEITFELLREASIRMPGSFGQTIGIVGALVIGQAAVQANIIGPVLTVIVSITAIGSFIIPSYNTSLAIRLLRFPMMILAGTMGLFGILFGLSLILIHLVRLRSFGVDYMASLTPDKLSQVDDSLLLKRPSVLQMKRPGFLRPINRTRRARRP
ncbi:spore germination protein [Paenibacillus humicola]|uniref:spore germination protein n=1 Tax=Paenibacillus humicola TaxID=3110540 RepID=UPI00237AF185|nr:spore germination protein [Paenibacillus humicola]